MEKAIFFDEIGIIKTVQTVTDVIIYEFMKDVLWNG